MIEVNKYIDSTLLKPDATEAEVVKLCADARKYEFASVCVNPFWVELVSRNLEGSDVATCVVIGFPLGATGWEVKVCEAAYASQRGAGELDMVMNIGAFKSRQLDVVERDIRAVIAVAAGKALVKVILECCLLSEAEKVEACELAVSAGADFVKTSTGLSSGGATLEDVRLLKETVGERARVKASGGIRELWTALGMIEAGADRIGTSAGVAIVTEAQGEGV